MKWKIPSVTKIYEALGAVADGRVEVKENAAKVYSSSRNKYYAITYNPSENEIMSNDNTSYWKGELGYPAVAFLMKIRVISYDSNLGALLKGIAWKDINQKFKNNFEKALEFILKSKSEEERLLLKEFTKEIHQELVELKLNLLGNKIKPPSGY